MNQEVPLKAIIGGTASSGSSLLAQILNRHSEIYCGPETNFLTCRNLRENWDIVKKKLITNDLQLQGWHLHRGVQLEYLVERERLVDLIEMASTYDIFISDIVSSILEHSSKKYFIEKTPSNAVHFHELSRHFPQSHLILTVRNPLDCIASMMARGWSVTYAVGLYLYNISFGSLTQFDHIVIKYEDLIADPSTTLSILLQQLGLYLEPTMLVTSTGEMGLSAWRSAEDGPVQNNESRFKNLCSAQQQEILFAVHKLEFSSSFVLNGIQPRFANIKEIAEFYNYEMPELNPNQSFFGLRLKLRCQILYQKCMRTFLRFNHGLLDFPFHLRS